MRLKGRQGRFLAGSLAGWAALRIVIALPTALPADGAAMRAPAWPITTDIAPFLVARGVRRGTVPVRRIPTAKAAAALAYPAEADIERAMFAGRRNAPHAVLRRAVFAMLPQEPPSPPPLAVADRRARRIEAQAYLFVRPGSGRAALAPGGSLGASQAAVRIAVPITPRLAIAARAYAPLETKGAEAAIGLDVRLSNRVPLRASIERRQRLDALGRSAWSAYLAGGAYTERAGLILDGYAQTGIVGAHRRDAFVDSALRAGMRLGEAGPIVGAAMWGAAQPGVARLDIGPRATLRLPVADHALSLAIEGRVRVAGRASPGSGVVLTLAADL